jgi:hypothetical protein
VHASSAWLYGDDQILSGVDPSVCKPFTCPLPQARVNANPRTFRNMSYPRPRQQRQEVLVNRAIRMRLVCQLKLYPSFVENVTCIGLPSGDDYLHDEIVAPTCLLNIKLFVGERNGLDLIVEQVQMVAGHDNRELAFLCVALKHLDKRQQVDTVAQSDTMDPEQRPLCHHGRTERT